MGTASTTTSSTVQVQGASSESTSVQVLNQRSTEEQLHGGSVPSSEIESTNTSLQIRTDRFDSNVHHQSSTTASEVNTTITSTEINQQFSTASSEIETTISSTEIQSVLMISKGRGRQFDSASHQEPTSTFRSQVRRTPRDRKVITPAGAKALSNLFTTVKTPAAGQSTNPGSQPLVRPQSPAPARKALGKHPREGPESSEGADENGQTDASVNHGPNKRRRVGVEQQAEAEDQDVDTDGEPVDAEGVTENKCDFALRSPYRLKAGIVSTFTVSERRAS
ncbi:hypothetical protein M407DRAFT_29714 [Tulasnella calospora MUT 4182]|uniref:Uncharacterized protein n=1 Tax=Tulasnella calospora MUT 4182 TaxID=1051891 RepID=A0A0C3LGR8_9AGAM|nr:hypothetical protein M407DRAFT_29714 [Tulasnella calospora MUT 4182]